MGHSVVQPLGGTRVPDSEHEVTGVNWLGDKVVGSRTDPGESVLPSVQGGHQQNWYHRRLLLGFELSADIEPIAPRPHDAQEYDVRYPLPRQLEPLIAVGSAQDGIAAGLEQVLEQQHVFRLVLNDEDCASASLPH